MKAIINRATKMLETVTEQVETREEYYWDRSEKWQESEKAERYEEKTTALSDLQMALEQFIEETSY